MKAIDDKLSFSESDLEFDFPTPIITVQVCVDILEPQRSAFERAVDIFVGRPYRSASVDLVMQIDTGTNRTFIPARTILQLENDLMTAIPRNSVNVSTYPPFSEPRYCYKVNIRSSHFATVEGIWAVTLPLGYGLIGRDILRHWHFYLNFPETHWGLLTT